MFEAFMACFPDPLSIASEVGSRQFVNPDSKRDCDMKEGKLAPESVLEVGKSTEEDIDGSAPQKYYVFNKFTRAIIDFNYPYDEPHEEHKPEHILKESAKRRREQGETLDKLRAKQRKIEKDAEKEKNSGEQMLGDTL